MVDRAILSRLYLGMHSDCVTVLQQYRASATGVQVLVTAVLNCKTVLYALQSLAATNSEMLACFSKITSS